MPPYVLLSLLIGAIYGILFFLWRGKSLKDLLIFSAAGVMGFIAGQIAANLVGMEIFLIGPVHMVEASMASWVMLFVTRWLIKVS